MRRHAKASSAVSTTHRGSGLGGAVRGAFATRGASADSDGTGAPSHARGRVAAPLLAIAALALLAFAPAALATPVRSLDSGASFPSTNPTSLAVDQSSGDTYVVDPNNEVIRRYDSSGNPAPFAHLSGSNVIDGGSGNGSANDATPDGAFDFDPTAAQIAVDNSGTATDGDIYVVDSGYSFFGTNSVVDIFSPAGDYLGQLTGDGAPEGNWAVGFAYPCGVAIGPDGSAYVSVSGASRVERYSPAAGSVESNSDYDTAITGIHTCGIAVNSSGDIYAARNSSNFANGPLKKYAASDFGTNAPTPTTIGSPSSNVSAVSIDPSTDEVYADQGDSIHVYDSSDNPAYTFGSGDFGTDSFGVAVKGNHGNAYVADPTHNTVDVYPIQVRSLDSGASFPSTNPTSLAVDQSSGDTYVVDPNNEVIRRYDSSGNPAPFAHLSGSNVIDGGSGNGSANDATPDGAFDFDPTAAQIAVDNSGTATDGDIYVVDSGYSFFGTNSVVDIFSPAGDYLGQLTGDGAPEGNWAVGFAYPCGVAIGPDGSAYVSVSGASRVERYSPAAGSVESNSDYDTAITGIHTCGIAVNSSGDIYAARNSSNFANGPLKKYAASDFGTNAPTPTTIGSPSSNVSAVSIDPSTDEVYADQGDSIHVYDSSDNPAYTFGSGDFGTDSFGVAVKGNHGNAYVADPTHNTVDVYPLLARPYASSYSSTNPTSLAVDQSSGDTYVVDPVNEQISRYDSSGNPAPFADLSGSNVIDGGSGNGSANDATPDGAFDFDPTAAQIAVDNSGTATDGDIYVVDSGYSFFGTNSVVDIFSPAGDYLGQLTGDGAPEGNWAVGFAYPCGVAIGPDGSAYVSVSGASRVERYSPAAGSVESNSDYDTAITGIHTCGIAVNSSGDIYAARNSSNFANGPLKKYAASDFGTNAPTPTTIGSPSSNVSAVSIDPSTDDVYADQGDSIHVYDSSDNPAYTFGSGDFGTDSFGVAVKGNHGNAYVADPTHNTVDVYRPYALAAPPGVKTGSASAVGLYTATLNATVNPNSAAVSDCHFEYVDDADYQNDGNDFGAGTQTATCSPDPGAGANGVAVHADLTGLATNTTYHYRIVATNSLGTTSGHPATFTTDPYAISDAANPVTHTHATLNGHFDPNNDSSLNVSDCKFDWGTTTAYSGGTVPCDQASYPYSTATAATATLPSLIPGTTYHFRLHLTTAGHGDALGADQSFTAVAYSLSTNDATGIDPTHATLNGHLDPDGDSALNVTECHFDWLSAADYAANGNSYSGAHTPATAPCDQNGYPLTTATDVTASLAGLAPSTTYHFRLHLTTASVGEFTGADKTLTTAVFPLNTDAATNVHHTDLTLNGHFDPQGDADLNVTECHFDWGLTTSYGHTAACVPPPSYSDSSPTAVSAFINDLAPGVTIHYRLHLTTVGAGENTSPDSTVIPSSFATTAPSQAGAFGPSGDNSIPFASGPGSLAFDNAHQRLYAVGSTGIYGFDASSPPTVSTVSGFTPLATAGTTGIAVDNSTTGSAGRLYALDGSNKKLYGYSSGGSPLGAPFPLDLTANPDFLSGSSPCGVGVDSTGRVWVSDPSSANNAPIFRYSSSGVAQSSLSEFFPCQLAFNPGDDLYMGRGGGQDTNRINAPSYASATTLSSHNSAEIAVDRTSGIVYLAESDQHSVEAFDQANNSLFSFDDGVTNRSLTGVAVDPSNHYVYVSDSTDHKIHVFAPGSTLSPPTLTQQAPTNLAGDSVTLNAKVDPETFQVTDCHFELVPDSQFQNDGFASVTAAQKHACAPDMTDTNVAANSGSGDVVVHADVGGLNGGTSYHTRIVAANNEPGGTATSADQSFTTNGPRVTGTQATSIADTTVTLGASVNPESADTTYQFQYTTDADFQSNSWANAQTAPASPSDIGNGAVAVPVHEDVTNLDPNTAYDFRIVAQNPGGTVDGPVVAFHTYTSPQSFGSCPNDQFRTGAGAHLPDCRAYEQASLVNKDGANALSSGQFSQAAADGDSVTYASTAGLPVGAGGLSSRTNPVLARRTASGWTTNSVIPLAAPQQEVSIAGWDPNLATSYSFDQSGANFYLGDLAAGTWSTQISASGGWQDFVTGIDGYSADPKHVLVGSRDALTFGAVDGKHNLYDDDHGTLRLADRVPSFPATSCNDQGGPPCLAPADGGFAGSFQWSGGLNLLNDPGKTLLNSPTHTQANTISSDGSRIVFTEAGTGRLYMRIDGTRTVQISAPAAGAPADPHKPAIFMAADSTDSIVYFASCEKLTADSTATSTAADSCTDSSGNNPTQTMDLYRYETAGGQLTDLTVDSGDPKGAGVQGVVGATPDGSWLYFVANGSLASGAPTGSCVIGGNSGSCGLYVSHDGGTPTYLGSLSGSDASAWGEWPGSTDVLARAVVAPDGTLVFTSRARLTAYDNTGGAVCGLNNNQTTGPCFEVYRYRPGDPAPTCVSCNPSGAAPTGPAVSAPYDGNTAFANGADTSNIVVRSVSSDGNRVFFQTPDKLVAADTNGDQGCPRLAISAILACSDPYEWEANGTGSCHSTAQDGGCLYLLSSGTSSDPSWLVDASASGNDVFIRTTSQLVPQDADNLYDVYDVRVDGGLAAQHQAGAPPCGSAEQCHGAGTTPPANPQSGPGAFSGPGNPAILRCAANKVKRGGRCVAKPHKKRKHHKKRHHKAKKHHKRHHARSHKRAGSNRGGSK